MKTKIITALAVISLIISLPGCSLLNSSATTAATTTTSEAENVGSSIKSLYTSYKANESLDLTDLSTLVSMKTIVEGAQNYKTNSTDADYYQSFVSGIIGGSDNLVNSDNVTSVLSSLEDVSETTTTAVDEEVTATASSLENSVSSIKSLLSIF